MPLAAIDSWVWFGHCFTPSASLVPPSRQGLNVLIPNGLQVRGKLYPQSLDRDPSAVLVRRKRPHELCPGVEADEIWNTFGTGRLNSPRFCSRRLLDARRRHSLVVPRTILIFYQTTTRIDVNGIVG